ncbi:hypothetical protein YA0002_25775, partial [Pseudomonas cichorii]|uniref:hypothetical protein n=1 Tax=Pseudomonas cichorii TaxID=36746 RepID=UPI0018E62374
MCLADAYLDPDSSKGGAAQTSAETLKQSGVLRDLVLGSEWNDDPDSLLRQNIVRSLQWNALFKDAQLQAQCKVDGTQPQCKGVKIADTPMMMYRSHFGDFQFIHAMASDQSETAADTKAKMMKWAEFTYTLSISSNKLGKEIIDGPTVSAFSDISSILKRQGWTVGALFDPVPGGEWQSSYFPGKVGSYKPSGKPRAQVTYSVPGEATSIKHIALGSLLHMVQDSYSDAHTERVLGCNPLSRERKEIISFRNYVNQIADDHAHADIHPKWLENGELQKYNPVWASAKLIQFSFNKTPWAGEGGVQEFLEKDVFPLSNPGNFPSDGDVDCYRGTQ